MINLEISEKKCMEYLINKFPELERFWREHVNYWGKNQGLIINMIPFGDYAITALKTNKKCKIRDIFETAEYLLSFGDESVQNAITTGFLEYLLNMSDTEPKLNNFKKYLGEKSSQYISAWIKFTIDISSLKGIVKKKPKKLTSLKEMKQAIADGVKENMRLLD